MEALQQLEQLRQRLMNGKGRLVPRAQVYDALSTTIDALRPAHPTTLPAPEAAGSQAGELPDEPFRNHAYNNLKVRNDALLESVIRLEQQNNALTARLDKAQAVAESAFQDAAAARDAHAAEVAGLRAGYAELIASAGRAASALENSYEAVDYPADGTNEVDAAALDLRMVMAQLARP